MKFYIILLALLFNICLVFASENGVNVRKPQLSKVAMKRYLEENPDLIQKRGTGGRCPYIYCVGEDDE
ncbi:hypothetical protein MFLAVUS_004797 [Mucor flavus]|uniref:Uncharacterized protein n=1 Tax=Mucor flavus TaxID=439312 RepID=A0ABP9YWX0_9FUNG